jgi:hypothetical protein
MFGASEKKSSIGTTWKTLENPRTIIVKRPETKINKIPQLCKIIFSRDLSRSWERKESTQDTTHYVSGLESGTKKM